MAATSDSDSDSGGVHALRRRLSDLKTRLALLPRWRRGTSDEIAASLLDVLVTLLRLDYAYIRLPDPADGPPVEVWHPQVSRPPDAVVHHIVVEQVPGTGIGLASVQELVQLHVAPSASRAGRERDQP